MSVTDKIIKNVFSSWAFYFTQFIIGFFLMPFMVHNLGSAVYGVWMLALSFIGYRGFVDFGITGSAVKYISEFEAKQDFDSLNKVVNTSWLIHIIIGLLVILTCFLASNFLEIFFKIDAPLINDFKICFRIMGLYMGLYLFMSIFAGILIGYKRQDIISGIEIITFIIQSILFVFSVVKGYGIVTLAAIILGVNIFKHIVRVIFSFKICPLLKLDLSLFSIKTLKLIFSYSIFLFSFHSLRNIINSLPNIIIGIFLGPVFITFYSIASRLVNYSRTFLSTTSGVLVPFISNFDALKNKQRLEKSFILGSKYCYMLIIFLSVVLFIMGKPFIGLWMGEEFADKSYGVLLIILLPLFLSPSALVINALLKGLARLREISFLALCEVILAILLSIFLIRRLGLIGMALGISIPYLINYGIILPLFVLNMLNIKLKDYIKEVFLALLLPGLILYSLLFFLKSNFYPLNYGIMIMEIIFSGLIYLGMCFALVLEKHERHFYLSRLRLVLGNS